MTHALTFEIDDSWLSFEIEIHPRWKSYIYFIYSTQKDKMSILKDNHPGLQSHRPTTASSARHNQQLLSRTLAPPPGYFQHRSPVLGFAARLRLGEYQLVDPTVSCEIDSLYIYIVLITDFASSRFSTSCSHPQFASPPHNGTVK